MVEPGELQLEVHESLQSTTERPAGWKFEGQDSQHLYEGVLTFDATEYWIDVYGLLRGEKVFSGYSRTPVECIHSQLDPYTHCLAVVAVENIIDITRNSIDKQSVATQQQLPLA